MHVSRAGNLPIDPPLTQARQLAVLAYLVLARPRGFQPRDSLLALFWPETDTAQARHALRNVLVSLRASLGEDAIRNAGKDQVAINPDAIGCDALRVEAHLTEGRWAEAVECYGGDLLSGFHVGSAPEFERWRDGERSRLHEAVAKAAWSLVEARWAAGDMAGAVQAARHGVRLAPEDEVALRRLLEVCGAAGDRATAGRAYREFEALMRREFGADPSPETREALRVTLTTSPRSQSTGSVPGSPATMPPGHAVPAMTRSRRLSRVALMLVPALAVAVILAARKPAAPTLAAAATPSDTAARRHEADIGVEMGDRYRADTGLFNAYLRAEVKLKARNIPDARVAFQQLADTAPSFAPAWAGLSLALSLSAWRGMAPEDAFPPSVAAAARAVALDSTLSAAHASLIAYDLYYRWDLPSARRRLDYALAMHPANAELNNLLAVWYRWAGELDSTVALKRRALALEPLSEVYADQVGWNLFLAHRCEEAAAVFRRLVASTGGGSAYYDLFRALRCLGRADEAVEAFQKALAARGDTALARLFELGMAPGKRDSLLRMVYRVQLDREVAARRVRWSTAETIVRRYADLLMADSTLAWLDSMYVERAVHLHVIPFDPTFDFLRGDPRFEGFLRRLPWKPRLSSVRPPTTLPTSRPPT